MDCAPWTARPMEASGIAMKAASSGCLNVGVQACVTAPEHPRPEQMPRPTSQNRSRHGVKRLKTEPTFMTPHFRLDELHSFRGEVERSKFPL